MAFFPRRHCLHVAVLVCLSAGAVTPLVVLTGPRGASRSDDVRANLARYMAARFALEVQPEEIVIPAGLSGGSGLHPSPVCFLGRKQGDTQHDVYLSHVVLSSRDLAVHASPLFPLTRTTAADEKELCLGPPGLLAFASEMGGKTAVVTVLDLAGISDTSLVGFSGRERLQQRLTNWQETGHPRGVEQVKIQLTVPQRVKLSWQGGLLQIENPSRTLRVVVDPARARVVSGPAQAARVRVPRRNVVAWAVDTVRNLSFVGPDRIAWLEDLVFGVVDEARRMSGTKMTLGEIRDEIDLPLIGKHATSIAGWPPPPLRTVLGERMPGEGQWVEVGGPFLRGEAGMPSNLAITFVRPDPERLYARVYFIAWDPRRLDLRMEAGLENPVSATGLRGSGMIPRDGKLLRNLVAAFNGGFQSTHGDFGMMVDQRVYAPAKPWAATVARLTDGSTGFGTWDGAARFGSHPPWIHSFRQNLTPLVEDSAFNPYNRGSWGGGTGFFTGKGAKAQTWRSGLCLHQSGHVMYVLGNPVDGPVLGKAMQRVGCTYAMELDINVTHVGFDYLNVLAPDEKDPPGAERFASERYFSHKGPWPGMDGYRYFMRVAIRGTGNMPFPRWTGRADEREFFYLVRRELLPGPDLAPLGGRGHEGRWTSASLPAAALTFPQAISRTYLHPDRADPRTRVHLVQLDLRWLDVSLCVPGASSDCLPRGPAATDGPMAVLPLGAFSAQRALLADGKSLGQGTPARTDAPYLSVRPIREGGAALPVHVDRPTREPGSISIQSAPEPAPGAGQVLGALCSRRDEVLLYAAAVGAKRAHLETALQHAGCGKVIHLGAVEPMILVGATGNATLLGPLAPPTAESPSLVVKRSRLAWGHRIFTHVKPQPRRVWTLVQPEWTRNSVLRKSNAIAKELGLPPIKDVNDLCRPPYVERAELRKLRWRDPITGETCGQGFAPHLPIDATYKELLKHRHTHGKRRQGK